MKLYKEVAEKMIERLDLLVGEECYGPYTLASKIFQVYEELGYITPSCREAIEWIKNNFEEIALILDESDYELTALEVFQKPQWFMKEIYQIVVFFIIDNMNYEYIKDKSEFKLPNLLEQDQVDEIKEIIREKYLK